MYKWRTIRANTLYIKEHFIHLSPELRPEHVVLVRRQAAPQRRLRPRVSLHEVLVEGDPQQRVHEGGLSPPLLGLCPLPLRIGLGFLRVKRL